MVAPLSLYGESRAAGGLVISLVPKQYTLRVSSGFGDRHSLPKTMKCLAEMRIDPKVVDDQYGRLTFASEIARATKHLLDMSSEYGNITFLIAAR